MKLSKTAFFLDTPSKQQWNTLTIDELIKIAKQKRSIKKPFKKILVDYLWKIGLR